MLDSTPLVHKPTHLGLGFCSYFRRWRWPSCNYLEVLGSPQETVLEVPIRRHWAKPIRGLLSTTQPRTLRCAYYRGWSEFCAPTVLRSGQLTPWGVGGGGGAEESPTKTGCSQSEED